jgi:predicted acetyltransferase
VLRRLLGEELRALAKAGVVLSTLYPSSPRVYRSFGYELAGATVFRKLSLANLTAPKALPLEPRLVEAGEEALIEPLHRADGEAREGRIDRGPLGSWWWTRAITKPFASPRPRTYAFMRGERAEGYLVITAYPLDQGRVHLHEWSATTPDAWTTLYGFLSGLRSVTPILSYTADARGTLALGVDVPVEEVAPEASYFGQPTASWMLRVLRPSDLLAGLHYAPGANAELHLALEDALIPENAGHWVLSVRDGRGRFERGGQGRVRLDVRALAALVAGHFDAPTLASAGLVSTDDAASLRSLTALLTRGPSFTWDVF